MTEYKLTTEQFKEFITPFLKRIKHQLNINQHRQVRFDVLENFNNGGFYIDYDIVGYFKMGQFQVFINNCFEIKTKSNKNGELSLQPFIEELQTSLWKYCYNLFGEEYKQALLNYFNSKKETCIKELTAYIEGVADYVDMYVADNETRSAKKEMEIVESYCNNCLEVISSLGKSADCN